MLGLDHAVARGVGFLLLGGRVRCAEFGGRGFGFGFVGALGHFDVCLGRGGRGGTGCLCREGRVFGEFVVLEDCFRS